MWAFIFVVDFIYEKNQKRSFLMMSVFVGMCVLLLIGIIILYRVLDPNSMKDRNNSADSEEHQPFIKK